jgi:hypothetical protein
MTTTDDNADSKAQEEEPIGPPDRLTPEEIVTLARQIVTNEVFFTTDKGLQEAFGFMLALTLPRMSDGTIQQIGGAYEFYEKQVPRAINGFPFFFSVRLLHLEDLAPLGVEVTGMWEALGLNV